MMTLVHMLAIPSHACACAFKKQGTELQHVCRLPDQAINVAVDPLNFALIHTVAKYLAELAPGWRLGRGRAVQWPPCITLSLLGSSNESHIFESDYVLGWVRLDYCQTCKTCSHLGVGTLCCSCSPTYRMFKFLYCLPKPLLNWCPTVVPSGSASMLQQ